MTKTFSPKTIGALAAGVAFFGSAAAASAVPATIPYTQTFGFVAGAGSTFPATGDGSEFSFDESGTPPGAFQSGTTGGVQKSTTPTGLNFLVSGNATSDTPGVRLALDTTAVPTLNNIALTLSEFSNTASTRITAFTVEFSGNSGATFTAPTTVFTTTAGAGVTPATTMSFDPDPVIDNNPLAVIRLRAIEPNNTVGTGARSGILLDNLVVSAVPATAVTWAGGKAVKSGRGNLVSWKVGSQVGNVGFDVLRVRKGTAKRVKVTKKLISALGGSSTDFSFRDATGKLGDRYYVVARATNGTAKIHGPLVAKASSTPKGTA